MEAAPLVVDVDLARRLVAAQLPRWSGLPLRPVPESGWDNRTFRLGDELLVRLPTGPWYAQAVGKEQAWLPRLAPRLPLPIPQPVAVGVPGSGYPYPWSVYRWIEGRPATSAPIADRTRFATALGEFLVALRAADTAGGPAPGTHNWYRGGPVSHYEEETLRSLARVADRVPREPALAVWQRARSSRWSGRPVWFHGDVAVGNLLVRDGRLAAVIDFGTCGVGDPACDLVIAWTLFTGPSRLAFRAAVGLDAATWHRGQGWALWKSLLVLSELDVGTPAALEQQRVIAEVLGDELDGLTR